MYIRMVAGDHQMHPFSTLIYLVCKGVLGCQYSVTFDPCSTGNHVPFPYMLDRCPTCEPVYYDRSDLFDLNHDIWYSTNLNITTKYVSPFNCGTRIPIWMNGSIPTTGDGVVARTACAATFTSTCAVAYSLQVKRCDTTTVMYCLENLPSSVQQRYCFDFDPQATTSTRSTPSKSPTPQSSVPSGGQYITINTADGTPTWVIVVIVGMTVTIVALVVMIVVILQKFKKNHRAYRPHSGLPPSYREAIRPTTDGKKFDTFTIVDLESKY